MSTITVAPTERISFSVSDHTGQHTIQVSGFPANKSVAEMLELLLPDVGYVDVDEHGKKNAYSVFSPRLNEALNPTDTVKRAIEEGEGIVFQPTANAGSASRTDAHCQGWSTTFASRTDADRQGWQMTGTVS